MYYQTSATLDINLNLFICKLLLCLTENFNNRNTW